MLSIVLLATTIDSLVRAVVGAINCSVVQLGHMLAVVYGWIASSITISAAINGLNGHHLCMHTDNAVCVGCRVFRCCDA